MTMRRWLVMGVLLTTSLPVSAQKGIPFGSDLDASLDEARQTGKPVVLAFGAVWCPNCRRMERTTLTDPRVLALRDQFHWVYIDVDRRPALARSHDVVATPQIYLLDSEGKARRRILGFVPPGEYARLLTEFAEAAVSRQAPDEPVEIEGRGTELTWSADGYRGLAICFSHVGYGPLRITSQSPFQALRLGLIPRTPSTLARGQSEVRGALTWANIWAADEFELLPGGFGDYFLDYETLHGDLAFAYGLTNTLQIEAAFETRRRFGGGMDGFIQGFHDVFGIRQSGRDVVEKDDFHFFLEPPGGPSAALDDSDKGVFTQNVLFTVQHNVTCGTQKLPALSWAVTGRFNVEDNDDLEGSDVDFGVSVAASRRFGNLYAYLTLGLNRYGSDRFRGIELRETQFAALAAVEWRYRPRQSFVFQWLASEGVAEDFDPFSKPAHEVTLGWKGEISNLGVLELGLIENFITFDNSPDFGVHAGYTQRW